MTLAAGERLGPYEITGQLGIGAMGEVYRATDTRLHREVAIKVSAENFSDRFEHEARAVAALNHPNIGTLYDIGPNYLVLELVEGETLAERIQQGAIPLEEALVLARQIAEALEVAHNKGIVHRDLKPANIKITPEGTVKVLDFGLAQVTETASPEVSDPAQSPTKTLAALTRMGAVMGTAGYMAPEQAKGRKVDKRADIWAFGVVLYEMVTGERLFQGEDLTEILASVVKEQPDLGATPARVRRLLSRCLEKDPKKRLRDISVAWELLEEPGVAAEADPSRSRLGWLPWTVAGMLAIALTATSILWLRAPAPETLSGRFEINPPRDTQFDYQYAATAISPDGRYIVFAAGQPGAPSLWLRPLDSLTARPLEGTERANFPFWSPDSKSIAFYQAGKLKRRDIVGGAPLLLCDAAALLGAGGSWSRDGTILFASGGGLLRISSTGGVPRQVTEPDATRKESGHGHPQFLPDGKHFLYFIESSDPNVQGIYAASLDNPKERVRVLATERKAYYVPPRDRHAGCLLWMQGRTLLAEPFDADKMSLSGDPTPVAEDLALRPPTRAPFWASEAGLLAYRTGDVEARRRLVWIGRDGKALGEALSEDLYRPSIRLSPDGKRVATGLQEGGNEDIWVLEFTRKGMTRLTFDPASELYPVWSPDGSRIAYISNRGGMQQIYWTAGGGGGREERLTNSPNPKSVEDWSRDGRYLLFTELDPKTGFDIWALPLEGERKPMPVLRTPSGEGGAQFSPDGKWIAYGSNSSGKYEVYVRAFPPGPGNPWQVSNQGGGWPRWRVDGKELYYFDQNTGAIMAASVHAAGAGFESEAPRELFSVSANPLDDFPYDVTADGQRFLVMQPAAEASGSGPSPLTVVTNWQAELKE
jgi:serine/threonine protein kinase/Tol biopolymer transport system component